MLQKSNISLLFTVLMVLGFLASANAQPIVEKDFSKQIAVTTDNDRYLMQGKDQYYTNGITINFITVQKNKKPSVLKQINNYEAGQKIYTPYSRKIYVPNQIDRPVTGYLYAKFTQTKFIQHNRFWQWGISAGTIGNSSLGKNMQNKFHKLINVNSDWWGWIWNYQLKDEPGINVHGSYAFSVLNNQPSFIQLTPVTQATLGTNFTNVSQGVLIQLGKLNKLHQSAYWNANTGGRSVQNGNSGTEVFFYYCPQVMYQVYNATIQGGMFRKDKGPITSTPEPFVVTHQLGVMYAQSRYTLKLEADMQTKEATTQRYNHAYGSIQVGYKFN